jgi:hypothetical protein
VQPADFLCNRAFLCKAARFPKISKTLKAPAGLSEYLLLRNLWKDVYDSDIGRAGILRFASAAGFDKVSDEIGFGPADPDLTNIVQSRS